MASYPTNPVITNQVAYLRAVFNFRVVSEPRPGGEQKQEIDLVERFQCDSPSTDHQFPSMDIVFDLFKHKEITCEGTVPEGMGRDAGHIHSVHRRRADLEHFHGPVHCDRDPIAPHRVASGPAQGQVGGVHERIADRPAPAQSRISTSVVVPTVRNARRAPRSETKLSTPARSPMYSFTSPYAEPVSKPCSTTSPAASWF